MSRYLLFSTILSFLITSCGNESSNNAFKNEDGGTEIPCNAENEGMIIKPADSDKDHICKNGSWNVVDSTRHCEDCKDEATSISSSSILNNNVILSASDESSSSILNSSSSSVQPTESGDNKVIDSSSSTETAEESSSSEKIEDSSSSEEITMFLCDDGVTYVLDLANCETESSSSEENEESSSSEATTQSSSGNVEESSSSEESEESSSSEGSEDSSSSMEQSSSSEVKIAEVKPNNYYRTNCPEGLTCEYVNTAFLNQDMLSAGIYGEILDERDGKIYKTIEINNRVWMAQNLNYDTTGTYCYNDIEENCERYGRFYSYYASDYSSVQTCPQGWEIPDTLTYRSLQNFAIAFSGLPGTGNKVPAAASLKSQYGDWYGWWDAPLGSYDFCIFGEDENCASGQGSNELGFSAIPLGIRHLDGSQAEYGKEASFRSKRAAFSLSHRNTFGLGASRLQHHPIRCILKQ